MLVINCTPHPFDLIAADGRQTVILPSGIVPRVRIERRLVGEIEVGGRLE